MKDEGSAIWLSLRLGQPSTGARVEPFANRRGQPMAHPAFGLGEQLRALLAAAAHVEHPEGRLVPDHGISLNSSSRGGAPTQAALARAYLFAASVTLAA